MSAAAGFVGGALGLIALEAAVSGKGPGQLSGVWAVADKAVKLLLDPTVPLIADHSGTLPTGPPVNAPPASGSPYYCRGPQGQTQPASAAGTCPAGWTRIPGVT